MTFDPLPLHQILFGFGVIGVMILVAWIVGGPER